MVDLCKLNEMTAMRGRRAGNKHNVRGPDWYKEELYHHEDSQAVEQVAQRGCAISTLRVFQNVIGQSTEHPVLISWLTQL